MKYAALTSRELLTEIQNCRKQLALTRGARLDRLRAKLAGLENALQLRRYQDAKRPMGARV